MCYHTDKLPALLQRAQAAHAEAEAANHIKDDFLALLSHELRTPLTSILGWSKMLIDGNLDDVSAKRALEIIVRNASAQKQLIDDLLDISSIVKGKLRLDVRSVELASIIEAAVDTVRPAADAKNIHLQLRIDSQAGPVVGDSGRLQQVIWNLLNNAIKFTPEGGHIYVWSERSASHVEIDINDTGQGITPEFLPHVFDNFRQFDTSSTRRHAGLGLGLSLVRRLVELHGGTITAESPGEGKGATFKVKLPVPSTVLETELRANGTRPFDFNTGENMSTTIKEIKVNATLRTLAAGA